MRVGGRPVVADDELDRVHTADEPARNHKRPRRRRISHRADPRALPVDANVRDSIVRIKRHAQRSRRGQVSIQAERRLIDVIPRRLAVGAGCARTDPTAGRIVRRPGAVVAFDERRHGGGSARRRNHPVRINLTRRPAHARRVEPGRKQPRDGNRCRRTADRIRRPAVENSLARGPAAVVVPARKPRCPQIRP